MIDAPTLAPGCTRPAAPDRHPPNRSVPLALSRFGVRRPASTGHAHPATTAAASTIGCPVQTFASTTIAANSAARYASE